MNRYLNSTISFISKERGVFVLGIFSLLVSSIFSINSCTIEEKRQRHEIRIKYLDIALVERQDVYEKESILELLTKLDDDKILQGWAKDRLKTIAEIKASKEEYGEETKKLVALNFRQLAGGRTDSEKLAVIERQKRISLAKLDSLEKAIREKEKIAIVLPTPLVSPQQKPTSSTRRDFHKAENAEEELLVKRGCQPGTARVRIPGMDSWLDQCRQTEDSTPFPRLIEETRLIWNPGSPYSPNICECDPKR
jgi:hypothetical protein